VHVHRESLARASSLGGTSSCCHHRHSLCQSATRLSTAGYYIHEPCPGDSGSVFTAPGERRGSVGSCTSSVSDCSGSRQCNDVEAVDDEGPLPLADSTIAPATSSSRVCVVQGLLRANGDSGCAMKVLIINLRSRDDIIAQKEDDFRIHTKVRCEGAHPLCDV